MNEINISVGFAGLGAMGYGMAANLLKAGFFVTGFDVAPAAVDRLVAIGGQAATSVQQCSHGQTKFFIMVATSEQVDGLVFGDCGLSSSLPPCAILCLFSTVAPAYVLSLRERLNGIGREDIRLVDCPVSGGAIGATNGTLTIMAGGDAATIAEIQPELAALSSPGRIFHTGALGSASMVKMLNQHLAGIHIVAVAEAIAFATALGLSSQVAYDILMQSEGASWIMGDRGKSMLKGDFTPRSAVSIFTKDLGIVVDAADEVYLPCPMASSALDAFSERSSRGFSGHDDASVVCNYEDLIGLSVKQPQKGLATPESDFAEEEQAIILLYSKTLAPQLREAVTCDPSVEKSGKLQVRQLGHLDLLHEALNEIEDQAIIGLPFGRDPVALELLSSQHPHLSFFDYQLIRSDKMDSHQIIFTSRDESLNAALKVELGPRVVPVAVKGRYGTATSMYLTVQLASLIHLAAAAECHSLARARGVSAEFVYRLISGAAGSSSQFNDRFPKMMEGEASLNKEAMEIALRDLKMIQGLARKMNFPCRMLNAAHQVFKNTIWQQHNGPSLSKSLTL